MGLFDIRKNCDNLLYVSVYPKVPISILDYVCILDWHKTSFDVFGLKLDEWRCTVV